MAFMTRARTINGGVQMRAEFINYLFSVPDDKWTGVLDTKARTPINWFDAWKEMCGTDMALLAAKLLFPLERYATDRILVAQQESRYGHRLVVLANQSYKIIDVRPGSVDRASVVIWEEV